MVEVDALPDFDLHQPSIVDLFFRATAVIEVPYSHFVEPLEASGRLLAFPGILAESPVGVCNGSVRSSLEYPFHVVAINRYRCDSANCCRKVSISDRRPTKRWSVGCPVQLPYSGVCANIEEVHSRTRACEGSNFGILRKAAYDRDISQRPSSVFIKPYAHSSLVGSPGDCFARVSRHGCNGSGC